MGMLADDIAQVLISEEQIKERTRQLARQLDDDYRGKDLLMICVLKGGVMFLADLMRALSIPHAIDFMATSSYGSTTESSGVVRILKDLDGPIEGRHVLVVEDIIDTGLTLHYLLRILQQRKPASIRVCTLLNKQSRRKIDVPIDYTGFDIPNAFVIGYGLDYAQLYRNLPFVGVLKPELYHT
jgi:hypoxanthine phosphoribosyltransferase